MSETTVKEQVVHAVEAMPDDATLEEVIERLVFLSHVRRGLDDLKRGDVVDQAEVEAEAWRG